MAYTYNTVTLDTPAAERVSRNYGMVTGSVLFDNYVSGVGVSNEITDITDIFLSIKRVICDGITSGGYGCKWNATSKMFDVFALPTQSASAMVVYPRAVNTVSAGTVNFAAFGYFR